MTDYFMFHGLPGSGKSTLADKLAQELDCHGIPYIRINRDNIRSEKEGEGYHKHPPIPAVEMKINRIIEEMINEALSQKINIIDDNTNLRTRDINVIREIVNNAGVSITHIPVAVSLDIAKERNAKRIANGGRGVPDVAIESMHRRSYHGKNPILDMKRLIVEGEKVVEIDDSLDFSCLLP